METMEIRDLLYEAVINCDHDRVSYTREFVQQIAKCPYNTSDCSATVKCVPNVRIKKDTEIVRTTVFYRADFKRMNLLYRRIKNCGWMYPARIFWNRV